MPRQSTPKPDDPAQSQRFRELAKEIGADTGAGAFKEVVRDLATKERPVSPPAPPRKSTTRRRKSG